MSCEPFLGPKCVFITGASSGFGAALARRFAWRGARVVLAGRRVDRVAALAAEIGERALTMPLDVQDFAAVKSAVAALPAAFASIDCLINSAGLALGWGQHRWRT